MIETEQRANLRGCMLGTILCVGFACQQSPPVSVPSSPAPNAREPVPAAVPSIVLAPPPAIPSDESAQLPIFASDVVDGDASALVTIVQAGSYEPGAGLDTPAFRTWLRNTYAGRVRLAIVRDKSREAPWFDRYGALTFINGVIVRAVGFADPETQERYYAHILQAELDRQNSNRASYADRVKRNLSLAAVATPDPVHPLVDRDTVWRAELDGAVVDGPKDALVTALLGCSPSSPICAWVYGELRKIARGRSLRIALRLHAENIMCEDELMSFALSTKGESAFFAACDDLMALQPKVQFNSISSDYLLPWNRAVMANKAPICGTKALAEVGKRYAVTPTVVKKGIDAARKALKSNSTQARRIDGEQALFINGRRLSFGGYGVPAPGLSTEQVSELVVQTIAEEEVRAKQVLTKVSVQDAYATLIRDGIVFGK
jgi:hypothetical protein